MRLDREGARTVREGLDASKEEVGEGTGLSDAIVLTGALEVFGEHS